MSEQERAEIMARLNQVELENGIVDKPWLVNTFRILLADRDRLDWIEARVRSQTDNESDQIMNDWYAGVLAGDEPTPFRTAIDAAMNHQ